jgi:hypothetical protein
LHPGPSRANTLLRDLIFALLVAGTCDEFGLLPTGKSARHLNACEVVAMGVAPSRVTRSARTIGDAWRKFGRCMPRKPPPQLGEKGRDLWLQIFAEYPELDRKQVRTIRAITAACESVDATSD